MHETPDSSGDTLYPDLAGLARLVGRRVAFKGQACVIHDVVAEPPVLVLRPVAGTSAIQSDTFGKPTRIAPGLLEVPLGDGSGPELREALREIRLLQDPEVG